MGGAPRCQTLLFSSRVFRERERERDGEVLFPLLERKDREGGINHYWGQTCSVNNLITKLVTETIKKSG